MDHPPDGSNRFRLNARLPVPFDDTGHMEVDLLRETARLAVELDGPQLLDSLDAYRRDRREDLLQEHGYLVFRRLSLARRQTPNEHQRSARHRSGGQ